jgi:hypothetical protein
MFLGCVIGGRGIVIQLLPSNLAKKYLKAYRYIRKSIFTGMVLDQMDVRRNLISEH